MSIVERSTPFHHYLVCILDRIANLKILRPVDKVDLNDMLTLVQMLVNDDTLSTGDSSKKPSYLSAMNDKLQSAAVVADLFHCFEIRLKPMDLSREFSHPQVINIDNFDYP